MKPIDVDAITKANATIDILSQRFPRAFSRDGAKRRPLKLGIHFDLVAALDGAIPSLDLRAALQLYTSSPWYQRTLIAGAVRVDLNGDEAGEVSAEHAEIARQSLTKRSSTSTPSPTSTSTPSPSPTSTPTPKPGPAQKPGPARDSFTALKAAAALRRQQQQQRDR
jgi:ProP effector